ncbi:hypothetical protein GCM10027271_54250 [Saccharopolyspora gloriosae]|uniref:Uncharacterized protein n=1 Tax=Saccharopolyspora gloriosae TaxID=455344 RepID=A0A840NB29_9PSEU|nr:hypothetical protein [Saccharopolyspora gloriosae]MBB5068804.1 hypothetical protein [Saccharopolyspora gloriosae]
MNWKSQGAIAGGAVVLVAVLAYLTAPFGSSSGVSIDTPDDDYRFSRDFLVRLAGEVPDSDRIWIVAEDEKGTWRPLAEATPSPKGGRSATVRAGKVTSPVRLCAVRTDTAAADMFHGSTVDNKPTPGAPELPPGSEELDCTDVEPAR